MIKTLRENIFQVDIIQPENDKPQVSVIAHVPITKGFGFEIATIMSLFASSWISTLEDKEQIEGQEFLLQTVKEILDNRTANSFGPKDLEVNP